MSDDYDMFDDENSDYQEWTPGTCDNCSGVVPGPSDPPFLPACACAIGQGAAPDECQCGDAE